MTEEVRLRAMTADDIDGVMAVADKLESAPHWDREMYEFMFEPGIVGLRIAVVAETSGEVVGFAVATVVAPEAELDAIAVCAGLQRRGVAGALFEVVLRELRDRGATEVLLEVRTSNLAARAFYRARGFEERGLRKAYYSGPVEDAIQMRYVLPISEK